MVPARIAAQLLIKVQVDGSVLGDAMNNCLDAMSLAMDAACLPDWGWC